MPNFDREIREQAEQAVIFSLWFWVVLGLFASVAVFAAVIRPWQLEAERNAIQQSQQYVETYQQRLVDLKADYARLEAQRAVAPEDKVALVEGQQRAVLEQMDETVAKLKPEQVPPSVKAFLKEHGR